MPCRPSVSLDSYSEGFFKQKKKWNVLIKYIHFPFSIWIQLNYWKQTEFTEWFEHKGRNSLSHGELRISVCLIFHGGQWAGIHRFSFFLTCVFEGASIERE